MTKYIKYREGQWFAVPLRTSGYGLGIIVRGEYKRAGGLGYFFGPQYAEIPTGADTFSKNKEDAILVSWFGDYSIIRGEWPLIANGKPFCRDEWPIPIFHREIPLPPGKAVLVEYSQDSNEMLRTLRETVVPITPEVLALPRAVIKGSHVVEIVMTRILDPQNYREVERKTKKE